MDTLSSWIALAGTVAFAVTAVLAVAPKGVDIFGAVVLGIITAVGGGTVRDLILGVPVFWSTDLTNIWVALGASLVAFVWQSFLARGTVHSLMLYLDGLGVALFAIEATHKVWQLNFGLPLAPIILGIVTAIGGGLMRDVLAGRKNLLMSRDIYAIPVLLGCTLYVILLEFVPGNSLVPAGVCFVLIFGLRAAAIHWNLAVPVWLVTGSREKSEAS